MAKPPKKKKKKKLLQFYLLFNSTSYSRFKKKSRYFAEITGMEFRVIEYGENIVKSEKYKCYERIKKRKRTTFLTYKKCNSLLF